MALTFQEALTESTLVFDGAMGTEIYRRGVFTNQCYDELNIKKRQLIVDITTAYSNAGVDVLTTNTYGANRFALEHYGAESRADEINRCGVEIARQVASANTLGKKIYIAGSVGFPSDDVLQKHEYSEVVSVFANQVSSLVEAGVDFVFFESQPSRTSAEIMVAAMRQAGEKIPFVVSYGINSSRFQVPNTIETRAKYFMSLFAPFAGEGIQPIAWGLNCSLGPLEMLNAVQEVVKMLSLPLIVQPIAGEPQNFEGRKLYYNSPEYLATYAMRYVDLGVAAVGGCCGTTPEEIAEVVKMVKPTSQSRRSNIVLLDLKPNVVEQQEIPIEERSRLAKKLYSKEWVKTVEAIPPCGFDLTDFVAKATTLHEAGVDAVNLPDGPRASSRISSIVAAEKVLTDANIEPVLHVCCRDRNLIGLQADLIGCAALNVNNLLFITGDPPKLGAYPNATGVFDCDSIGLCELQRRLNRGIDLSGQSIGRPTKALFGCGFDPSALNHQREKERLKRKVEAGALFAVTQPVFDPKVLISFLEEYANEYGEIPIPVIAGIWPFVSYRNALFMRKEVPGVVVPDEIMETMERAASISKEAQVEAGIRIAISSLETIRPFVQGVQVSAPLGRIDISLKVLSEEV